MIYKDTSICGCKKKNTTKGKKHNCKSRKHNNSNQKEKVYLLWPRIVVDWTVTVTVHLQIEKTEAIHMQLGTLTWLPADGALLGSSLSAAATEVG